MIKIILYDEEFLIKINLKVLLEGIRINVLDDCDIEILLYVVKRFLIIYLVSDFIWNGE